MSQALQPPPETHTPANGGMNPADLILVIASVVIASALYVVRKRNGRPTELGQWLLDGLSVGTLILLGIIGLVSMMGDRWGLTEVVINNKYLIVLSLIYCGGVIGSNLVKSVRPVLPHSTTATTGPVSPVTLATSPSSTQQSDVSRR